MLTRTLDYSARLGGFVFVCLLVVWATAMLVSLGLGTTEFGTTPEMRATVHLWTARLMWCGVAAAILYVAVDLFVWLMTKFKLGLVVLLLAATMAGPASAEYTGYGLAMTRDTPGSVGSLGAQSWCCGRIPSGSGPRSAPASFYSAVKSGFGSMFNAIRASNDRLNRTSGFDPTFGATNYNSNLGSMDPASRGSGVTAW